MADPALDKLAGGFDPAKAGSQAQADSRFDPSEWEPVMSRETGTRATGFNTETTENPGEFGYQNKKTLEFKQQLPVSNEGNQGGNAGPEVKSQGSPQTYKDYREAFENAPTNRNDYRFVRGQNLDGTPNFYWQPKASPQGPIGNTQFAPEANAAVKHMIRSYTNERRQDVSDDLGRFTYSVGAGLNMDIANTLGTPVDLLTSGLNYITGPTGLKPIEDPVGGAKSVGRLMGKIGINTNPDESTIPGYYGSKVGQMIGATLPFLGAYGTIAKMSKLDALTPGIIRDMMTKPLPYKDGSMYKPGVLLGELTGAGGAGLGAATGGELSKDHTFPLGQASGEFTGALLWSARNQILSAGINLGKAALGRVSGNVDYKAGRILTNISTPSKVEENTANINHADVVPDLQPTTGAITGDAALRSLWYSIFKKNSDIHAKFLDGLDAEDQAVRAAGQFTSNPEQHVATVLRERLMTAVESAKTQLAAIGGILPTEGNSQTRIAQRLDQAAAITRREIDMAEADASTTENILWRDVPNATGIKYNGTQDLFNNLKNEFSFRNTDPKRFPYELEDRVLGDVQESDTASKKATLGLLETDSLAHGQQLRSDILYAIRKERALDVPDTMKIGYMEKLQRQLLDDMGASLPQGALPNNPLNNALAFSRQKNEVFGHPTVAKVLSSTKRGLDKVSDMEVLEQFLKQGQAGGDAADALQAVSQFKYGGDGPGSLQAVAKDTLRQMFINSVVSPGGNASAAAVQQFREKFRNLLARWPDLDQQFESVGTSEQGVEQILGTSRPGASEHRQARAELYMDNPVGVTMKYVFTAPDQQKAAAQIVAQMKRDPTGNALKGFVQLVVNKMFADTDVLTRQTLMTTSGKRVSNQIAGWLEDNQGIVQAIENGMPGFKARAQQIANSARIVDREFSNPGLDVKHTSDKMNFVTRLLASYGGAHLFEKLGSGFGSTMVLANKGSEFFNDMASKVVAMGPAKVSERITEALVNPDVYKLLTSTENQIKSSPILEAKWHAYWNALPTGSQGPVGNQDPNNGR